MAFTTSSRVRNIDISSGGTFAHRVTWEWWDGTAWQPEDYNPGYGVFWPVRTDLRSGTEMAVLQQMYLHHSFRDTNDNPVSPTLNGFEESWPESLLLHYPNPLDPNDFARYLTTRHIFGILKKTSTAHHGSAGQPDHIEGNFGLVLEPHEAQGEGSTRLLNDWQIGYLQSITTAGMTRHTFEMVLPIPSGRIQNFDELDSMTQVVGMLQWLNSIKRTSDSDVGSDASELASYSNRRFTVSSSLAGSTNFAFTIHRVEPHLTRLDLLCTLHSGTFDRNHISHLLDQVLTIDVPGITIRTDVPFGHNQTPLVTPVIRLSNDVELQAIERNLALRVKDRGSAERRLVPLGAGRIVNHRDLSRVAADDAKVVYSPVEWEIPLVSEIHYDGNPGLASGPRPALRLRPPIRANQWAGLVKTHRVYHKPDSTVSWYIVEAWDGEDLVHLYPGESCIVHYERDLQGHSFIDIDAPNRWSIIRGQDAGTLQGGIYWDYDTNHWARPIPPPMGNTDWPTFERRDGDAFGVPSSTNTENREADWSADNVTGNRWFIEMRRSGYLHYDMDVRLSRTGTPSGTIPAGARVMLYIKRGSSLIQVQDNVLTQPFTASSPGRSLIWSYRGRVQSGDIFVPIFVFQKGTNYGTENLTVATFTQTLELYPNIRKQYEATS